MDNFNPQISLGSFYSLKKDWLLKDENVIAHWDIEKSDEILSNISVKQKTLIIALVANKNYIKLNEVFESWGMPRK
jgi:hypothetical protein